MIPLLGPQHCCCLIKSESPGEGMTGRTSRPGTRSMSFPVEAFILNPVLPILVVVGALLGVLFGYVRGRAMLPTVLLVVGVALVVYVCAFLTVLGPILGAVTTAMVLAGFLAAWWGKFARRETLHIVGISFLLLVGLTLAL
jgi:hypothetical protein